MITKNLITLSSEFQKEPRKGWGWKGTQRNNGWKLTKFGKRFKPTYSRVWASNRTNLKKSIPTQVIVKLLKTKDKDSWSQWEKTDSLCTGRKLCEWQQISNKKPKWSKGNGTTFCKCKKKITVNPESYIQHKYPSEMNGKSKLSNEGPTICPKRIAEGSSLNRK